MQKFIAEDLALDRGALGLMGSAFFYSYTLFQMSWGIASDRLGSRTVIGLGILLTAATVVGFALGDTTGSFVFWRVFSGIAAAAEQSTDEMEDWRSRRSPHANRICPGFVRHTSRTFATLHSRARD